ncbi:DUF72 domain-containing protein [Chryseobacterium vrystaatense]|uniref:Histidine kinase n=1 Tax=Chryseobacterium vrystaatense TaxID=307480 RepID=A0A1M5DCU4_9FLAO|nr:DUF72 domain-containing protein [Chryseobacterium vrystaatense]KFF23572.1 histidine kinase [Chryseobacterium vrystaatense]SHF64725.1 Uncharacterized conserved protein YecE, DUF72 family [Chryseobacterium vrystaatense]
MKKESLYIGCSGFYNNDWKGSLYPETAQSKDFLILYSSVFNSVEINSTFYRKPTAKTLLKWHDETPDDFKFFIKIPKAISHEKRLKDSKEDISEFCSHIETHLKEKLSGFLYQFPPSFKKSQENIDLILSNINVNYLNVIEFRHESWWNDEVFKLLKENNIIFSGVSFPGNLPEELIINHPDYLYYRLHGKPVLYKSEYSPEFIDTLAEKIAGSDRKAFIFFNNTWGTAAIKNALYLKGILE